MVSRPKIGLKIERPSRANGWRLGINLGGDAVTWRDTIRLKSLDLAITYLEREAVRLERRERECYKHIEDGRALRERLLRVMQQSE